MKKKGITKTKVYKIDKTVRKKKSKQMVSSLPVSSSDYSKNWKAFLETRKQGTNHIQDKKEGSVGKNISKKEQRTNFSRPKTNPTKNKWSVNKVPRKRKPVKDDVATGPGNDDNSRVNKIWFDDVDPLLIERECGIKKRESLLNVNRVQSKGRSPACKKEKESNARKETLIDRDRFTKYVGLDCEMVGIGIDGKENALARVSIVNSLGECLYDTFVKQSEKVVDFRTSVSGVRLSDVKDAPSYEKVQREVYDILKGRVLVGHALQNDLKALLLSHSRRQIRDTAKYKPFRKLLKTKRPALKRLAEVVLNEKIQDGEHSSVVDARTAMKLYQLHKKDWEKSVRSKKDRNMNIKPQEVFTGSKSFSKKKVNKYVRRKIEKRKKRE